MNDVMLVGVLTIALGLRLWAGYAYAKHFDALPKAVRDATIAKAMKSF